MRGFKIKSKNGNEYFYNDDTGFVFNCSNEEWKEKYNEIIEKCKPRYNQVVANKENIDRYLYDDANGFRQLILEVASGCNLRCKYCIYSEHYPNYKTYTDQFMTFDIAKKAIDYYMKNFEMVQKINPTRVPNIGFYGGEPLLNFKLIKEIVNYVKDKYENVEYHITTNGLLLNEEVQEFFVRNSFSVTVSLDGNKEEHDRNRVKVNGNGSFDEIIRNIRSLKKNYPEYNKMGISFCFDFKTNFDVIEKFMDEEDLFITKFSFIDQNDTTYFEQFTEEDIKSYLERKRKIEERFKDICKSNTINKRSFIYAYLGIDYAQFAFHPVYNETRPLLVPYSGTCVPGEKIYVTIDGKMHICEKINQNYPIGDVDNGLNYDNMVKIIDDYNKLFEKRCKNCNISRFCSICYAQCCQEKGFKKEIKECKLNEVAVRDKMKTYIDLLEESPGIFEEITVDYYNEIHRKMSGCFEF